jgi:Na+/melibiose symporter-like transporter
MKQKFYWRITAAVAIFLMLITFTPLVIAPGKTEPELFSMPYTLWVSILITIGLVVLTYIGGRVHLNDEEPNSKKQASDSK